MKRISSRTTVAVALASLALATPRTAAAAWTDGQAAVAVLGQTGFSGSGPNAGGVSASTLAGPTNICSDTAHGKLYVMDYSNHRVLRYGIATAITTGSAAEAVLGQPDFITVTGGRTAAKMLRPEACAISPTGTLFVADAASRVLRFDDAHLKASGADADGVLGSPDFTTAGAAGPTAATLGGAYIYGLAYSSTGALFVPDYSHNRVLRFDSASTKANGASADGVLGQADFVSSPVAPLSATSFKVPYGLAFDAHDNLFVVDSSNYRVLRFDNAPAKANGAAADGVLGASDFTTAGSTSLTASTFGLPFYSVGVGGDGNLYVGDFSHNRMMIFDSPATKANGASADHVLGAPDFTTNGTGTSASSLNQVLGLGFSSTGYFFVGDYGHNRVMVYYNAALVTGAPTAPAVASATAGDTQATVVFTAPETDGHSAITGYTVTSDPAGGVDSNAGSTGLSHVMTGLTNGTAYTFTVKATNALGTSVASAASASATPVGMPGAPSDAVATATSGTEATVVFAAPASNGGSAVTGYTVVSSPAGGVDSNAGSTGLSHVMTGLTSGTAYTFTVTATTTVGTSVASATSNSVTPVGVPGAPITVVASAHGEHGAVVTFAAPPSNGGGAVTGYTVTSDPAGGVDSNASTTGLSHVMTGLVTGTAYTFTVTATNSAGTSSSSAASNGLTPAAAPLVVVGVPGAPSNVVAKSLGNGKATVTFAAPASNGGADIIGYAVSSSPADGIDADAASLETTHTITGLKDGVSYSFTVTAVSSAGSSVASPRSNAVENVAPAVQADAGSSSTATTTAVTVADEQPIATDWPSYGCGVVSSKTGSSSDIAGLAAMTALVLVARRRRKRTA